MKGAGTGDLGEPATKETVTESAAARKEALLSSSALRHSWLAAAALSAAEAGGTGLGTARGWQSGTVRALKLPGSCREGLWDWLRPGTGGDSPYSELGLRFPGPS